MYVVTLEEREWVTDQMLDVVTILVSYSADHFNA